MGIVSKVEEKQEKEITFPCLMRNKAAGHVVLFSSDKTGIVVYEGDEGSPVVGYYCDHWISATEETVWEPSQPVTLSNS